MNKKQVFYGRVNDQEFDNTTAMQDYIAYCIDNGIDIYSVTTKTYWKPEDDCRKKPKCQECSEKGNHQKSIKDIEAWPEVYETLEDYIVPFVMEKAFDTSSEDVLNAIVTDVDEKLKDRCSYFVNNLFNSYVSADKFNYWVTPHMVDRLGGKINWCNTRLKELETNIKNGSERIKRLQAEIDNIKKSQVKNEALISVYDSVGGYCTAMVDKIKEDPRYKN